VGEPYEANDEYNDDHENGEDALHALSLHRETERPRRMALLLYSEATAIGASRQNRLGERIANLG
jgi:hypothetical protein